MLYKHTPVLVGANILNSCLITWVLSGRAPLLYSIIWLSLVNIITIARAFYWLVYLKRRFTKSYDSWTLNFTIFASATGVLWGAASFLYVGANDLTSLALFCFLVAGMTAGAVVGLSAHLPALVGFVLGCLLPFEARLLIIDDQLSLCMVVMAATYAFFMLVIARNLSGTLVRALVLSQQNQELLATRDEEIRQRTAHLESEIESRKLAEAKAETARLEAQDANDAKTRFLACASHDLRQPLQALFLFSSALERHIPPQGSMAFRQLKLALITLKSLVDGLLDLATLDVKMSKPNLSDFSLDDFLYENFNSYETLAAEKGLRFNIDNSNHLVIHSDKMMLGRLIRNLVDNAIKYTERGYVALSATNLGSVVRVTVEDTGLGIAEQELRRIFEEFHQISNPERDRSRGLGLGLAIVRRLSSILDHPVHVSSQLGVGSTFSVDVPVPINIAKLKDEKIAGGRVYVAADCLENGSVP